MVTLSYPESGPEETVVWLNRRSVWGLIGFLALTFAAGALGGIFTELSVETWYPGLKRPAWAPPNYVFAPVWTLLYVFIALAGWIVWRRRGWSGARWALGMFVVQLVLNAAWSGLFFGLRNPGAAFIELIVLACAIVVTMALFRPISRAAAILLLPYLLWVIYAGTLNYAIWRMNG